MSQFLNGNRECLAGGKIAPVPKFEDLLVPKGRQQTVEGVSNSSSISDSNSGWGFKTKKPKKERKIWSTVIELLRKTRKH